MRRSALPAKVYKDKKTIYERMYKKQKNFCSRLYKRERRILYNNFDLKDFTDNKRFWTAIKPFLSKKINLKEGNTIISHDSEVAEILNTYFSESVNSLEIEENKFIVNSANHILNSVDKALYKFHSHPSILKIKETAKGNKFTFSNLTQDDLIREINKLNHTKANT